MMGQSWYDNVILVPPGMAIYGVDWEGAGSNRYVTVSKNPPVSGVGIITYSGSGTNKTSNWFNNVQGDNNATPTEPVSTQSRMTIGCDGDIQDCGPVMMRDLLYTSTDVSATIGLPAAIYNYLTNIYAGL